MVEYKENNTYKRLSVREIATLPKWIEVNGKVKEADYFIKRRIKEGARSIDDGVRHKKSELRTAINRRIDLGWEEEDIIIENVDMPYKSGVG